MDFKTMFQNKMIILYILFNIVISLSGSPVPDTKTKPPGAVEKPLMACDKKFCDLFPDICMNGGTCISGKGCEGYCQCTKYYKGRHCQIKIDAIEEYNGHGNGNDNGNDDGNGNGDSNSPAQKKPAVGVIMKLFKGLRTNGNGGSSTSNTANEGKKNKRVLLPSKVPPVKPAKIEEKKMKNILVESRSEPVSTAAPGVTSNNTGNGSVSVTINGNQSKNTSLSGKANADNTSDIPSVDNTSTNKRISKTSGKLKLDSESASSKTVDSKVTTRNPIIQTVETLGQHSNADVVGTDTGTKSKSVTHIVKPTIVIDTAQRKTTKPPHQPKPSKKMTENGAMRMISKPKTKITSGTTSINKTTETTTTVKASNKSESEKAGTKMKSGLATTVITKIIIGNSKNKHDSSPQAAIEIPVLRNSEVSSSNIADSVASFMPLSNGEIFIRDVPITAQTGDVNHKPKMDIARSAPQFWRDRNTKSSLPVTSKTVKSTVDDANRWLVSGFEPDFDKSPRENMALVLSKNFLQKEDNETKSTLGDIVLVQSVKNNITTDSAISVLTKTSSSISKANVEPHIGAFSPPTFTSTSEAVNQTSPAVEHSVVSKTQSLESSGNSNSIKTVKKTDVEMVGETVTPGSSKLNSDLPEEHFYLTAAVYKKFLPLDTATNAEQQKSSLKTTVSTAAGSTIAETDTKHDSLLDTKSDQEVTESASSTFKISSGVQTIHVTEITPRIPPTDQNKHLEKSDKSFDVKKNDTHTLAQDTAITTLEKLKTLLVYVQNILSSTKSELAARKENNGQPVSSTQTETQIPSENKPDNTDSLREATANLSKILNQPMVEQESINVKTDINDLRQKTTKNVTTETAQSPTNGAVGTTPFDISDITDSTSGNFPTNIDAVVKIPIFTKRSNSTISSTVQPVVSTVRNGLSATAAGLSETDKTGPRRHVSSIARILRKIYGIRNFIARSTVKITTTAIPKVSIPDTEQHEKSLFKGTKKEGIVSTSEPTRESYGFGNIHSKDTAHTTKQNRKRKSDPDSQILGNFKLSKNKVGGLSMSETYVKRNKTVKSGMDTFYGHEDMIGNFIVDSTSTMKPYTMPPTTEQHDIVQLQTVTNTDERDLSKPQSDFIVQQRTKSDSVNLSPLETILTLKTDSPRMRKTDIS
ncbi:serine-rich adhesin for platelets-like [Ylistrum balloti]|uniref:serine-rich adhesin for platelets-like n=1 Tax=Ylistrum balloti TaxID=509963 RepID=UPI002905CF3C|nr:serine-rich adhesin for platelets-like [Ylistrum balloti]